MRGRPRKETKSAFENAVEWLPPIVYVPFMCVFTTLKWVAMSLFLPVRFIRRGRGI